MPHPQTPHPQPSESTLNQIQTILTQIRTNLSNTSQTWGKNSPQYRQATEMMDQYLEENMTRLEVGKGDIVGLLGSLSLYDHDDEDGAVSIRDGKGGLDVSANANGRESEKIACDINGSAEQIGTGMIVD